MVAPDSRHPNGFKLKPNSIEGQSFPFDVPKPEDRGFGALNLVYYANRSVSGIAMYSLFFTSSNNPGLGIEKRCLLTQKII